MIAADADLRPVVVWAGDVAHRVGVVAASELDEARAGPSCSRSRPASAATPTARLRCAQLREQRAARQQRAERDAEQEVARREQGVSRSSAASAGTIAISEREEHEGVGAGAEPRARVPGQHERAHSTASGHEAEASGSAERPPERLTEHARVGPIGPPVTLCTWRTSAVAARPRTQHGTPCSLSERERRAAQAMGVSAAQRTRPTTARARHRQYRMRGARGSRGTMHNQISALVRMLGRRRVLGTAHRPPARTRPPARSRGPRPSTRSWETDAANTHRHR